MGKYRYQALDLSGAAVAGEIEAGDRRDAAARLRTSGMFPTALEGPLEARPGAVRQAAGPRLGRGQVAEFTRQLADLISSGIPPHRCLTILGEQARGRQRELLESVRQAVQRGEPFSEGLRAFPRSFPKLYVEMIRAGESSGHLDEVLQRLADYLERQEVRRSQIVSALTYPAVIVLVAIGAVVFMVTFLVPRLSVVFADLGQALPAPTRLLLAVAHAAPTVVPWLAGGLALLYAGWRRAAAVDAVAWALDLARLRIPLIGSLASKAAVGRFARTLGTLLAGGVPMLGALEIAGAASANQVIARAAAGMQQQVREGESLSSALAQSRRFPLALVDMTAVGEETGKLPAMLIRHADASDFQFDLTMKRLTSLLEPAVILLMGGVVAFIVLSILLPVFEIYSSANLGR